MSISSVQLDRFVIYSARAQENAFGLYHVGRLNRKLISVCVIFCG